MTYLEKFIRENPDADITKEIEDECPIKPHEICPLDVGEVKKCKECWLRKIPDEQPTDIPTQPQILDSGNREEDTRKKILEDAIYFVCTDRKQQYGKPENSFSVIANFWSLYIKHKYDIDIELTAADAAMMLALFKIARGVTATKQKLDTYVDICGYAACAGELECKEEK